MSIISSILQTNSIVFEFQSIHIFKLQKEQKKYKCHRVHIHSIKLLSALYYIQSIGVSCTKY